MHAVKTSEQYIPFIQEIRKDVILQEYILLSNNSHHTTTFRVQHVHSKDNSVSYVDRFNSFVNSHSMNTKGNTIEPSKHTKHKISNDQEDMWFYHEPPGEDIWDITSGSDRILAQLVYMKELSQTDIQGEKVILSWTHGGPDATINVFKHQRCPVHQCRMTRNKTTFTDVDAVMFFNYIPIVLRRKPANQIWVYYQLESPKHVAPVSLQMKDKINWTATYQTDSTIVTPYEKYVPFDPNILHKPHTKNYAFGKTKMAAWFVSHCSTPNNRLQFAKSLGNHIQVDIYGTCGRFKCPKSRSGTCYDMLNKDYKFYLAFENSNCQDYITEKFYWNALGYVLQLGKVTPMWEMGDWV